MFQFGYGVPGRFRYLGHLLNLLLIQANVQLSQVITRQNERVVDELIDVDSVVFVGLETLGEEQCGLDCDWFTDAEHVVATVYLLDQVLHLVRMERSTTHHELVAHYAQSPNVDFVRVRTLS